MIMMIKARRNAEINAKSSISLHELSVEGALLFAFLLLKILLVDGLDQEVEHGPDRDEPRHGVHGVVVEEG